MRYDESHTNNMSWDEFHSYIHTLLNKIEAFQSDNNIKQFDAVIPILRTGGIPATMIANKLRIIPMIPIQVKYNYGDQKIQTLVPPTIPETLNSIDNVLVVECNTCTARTADKVNVLLKDALPNTKLHYISVCKAYGDDPKGYDSYHYGCLTNELFEIDEEQAKTLGLRQGIVIFPWETAKYELADVNGDILP